MFDRFIRPLRFDEFTARALAVAAEREAARLLAKEHEARDKVERVTWAAAHVTRRRLSNVAVDLTRACQELGPLTVEDTKFMTRRFQSLSRLLPRSKANSATLRAEREAKVARSRLENAPADESEDLGGRAQDGL